MLIFGLPNLLLSAHLAFLGTSLARSSETPERFLERVRVLGTEPKRGEATILDPEGRSRTLKEGDRIDEEAAVLKEVTRSSLVLLRIAKGADGRARESLVVVRFDASGKVTRVREYSTGSDAALPVVPRRNPLD